MKIITLSAAALFLLAGAACHREQTREKIADMESRAAENAAATDAVTGANEAQPPQ